MKLDHLWVESFKNLQDFSADFDEDPNELFAVLLGRNGLGKSNLLEVLVVIFRDLFLGNETNFGYELRYTLRRGNLLWRRRRRALDCRNDLIRRRL